MWYHTLNKKRTLKNTGNLQKILERSGKFVSPKKWEPWPYHFEITKNNPFQVEITTALPINYVCTYMKLQPKIRLGCKMWKCDFFIEVVDDLRLVVKNLENRIIALESGSCGGAKPQVTIVTAISFWHEFIPYHTCIILQSYGSHFMYAHTITHKWTYYLLRQWVFCKEWYLYFEHSCAIN